MIIDTHIHLNDNQYDEDLDEVIKRSHEAGIEKVVLIGCDHLGMKKAINMKKIKPEFYNVAIGLHPIDIEEWTPEFKQDFIEMIENNNIIAIGEIGLDYHWYPEKKERQKEIFKEQLSIAQKYKLPVIIHSREAYNDCYEILKEYPDLKGVIHSFSDNYNMAKKFIDLGYYIGIGGPVTFKNGQNQQDVVEKINLNKLLIETDGPYLTPVPYRGKRNEPKYLHNIIDKISEIKKIEKEEIIKITTNNALQLFERI